MEARYSFQVSVIMLISSGRYLWSLAMKVNVTVPIWKYWTIYTIRTWKFWTEVFVAQKVLLILISQEGYMIAPLATYILWHHWQPSSWYGICLVIYCDWHGNWLIGLLPLHIIQTMYWYSGVMLYMSASPMVLRYPMPDWVYRLQRVDSVSTMLWLSSMPDFSVGGFTPR